MWAHQNLLDTDFLMKVLLYGHLLKFCNSNLQCSVWFEGSVVCLHQEHNFDPLLMFLCLLHSCTPTPSRAAARERIVNTCTHRRTWKPSWRLTEGTTWSSRRPPPPCWLNRCSSCCPERSCSQLWAAKTKTHTKTGLRLFTIMWWFSRYLFHDLSCIALIWIITDAGAKQWAFLSQ